MITYLKKRQYPTKRDPSMYDFVGPWTAEPDKEHWIDEATGLDCLIVRNRFGALCGYVGVNRNNNAYGKGYDDVEVDVHGGLTFASTCDEEDDGTGICHVPAPGRDGDVWWLGFDCSHYMDTSPGMLAMDARIGFSSAPTFGTYKDISYVEAEVSRLAAQLKELEMNELEMNKQQWHNYWQKLMGVEMKKPVTVTRGWEKKRK